MDYFVAQRLRRVAIALVVVAIIAWVWHAFFWDVVPLPDVPRIPGLSTRDDGARPESGTSESRHAQTGTNPPLYKWKDAQGRWNVTDQPPKNRPYEKVVVNPDTNVIPSVAPPAEEENRDD